MTKENTKTIQTALWVALVLVQMAVVDCLEVHAKPVQEEPAQARSLQAGTADSEPSDDTKVRREVLYEAIEGEAALPSVIDVSVLAGNEEEVVSCQTVEQLEESLYWQDDFSFPLTFYEYGADAYQMGDVVLDGENLSELVRQYGEELLQDMGLSPEDYEVTELSWAGEPYVNEDGITCRDAVGRGSRLLRDYRVVYEGYVDPQRWKELKAAVQGEELELAPEVSEMETETLEKPTEVRIETKKEVEAEPETKPEKSRLREFLEKVTKILLIAVGIGVIFFLGGLLVLALLWVVRKVRGK